MEANFDIVKVLSSFSKIPSYIEKDIEDGTLINILLEIQEHMIN
jgi:hypothetical protein